MTDDNDVYTPAQFREHQDGFGVRDANAHTHTGIVRDPLVSRFLSIQAENYDLELISNPEGMPGEAKDLTTTKEMRAIGGTETARKALEGGDMPTLKHLTGDQKQRADISGWKAMQDVDQIIMDPAPVIVIIGDMGSGKTDAACMFGQRAKHLLGIDKVAANIPTLRETDEWEDQEGNTRSGFVCDYRSLVEWVEQDGDPLENDQQAKLYIGDEFSSVGSGVGKDGYMMRQKMGPLVFKIRKYNGMLIYIAHDESSVHPLLWRVGYIVKKHNKKDATIADKIKSGEVRDVKKEITGFPPTDWRFKTEDPAVWSWTEEDDGERPEPGEVQYDVALWTTVNAKNQGMANRAIAEIVPYSREWVRRRWKEYNEEGEHTEALARVEERIA